MFYLTTHSTHFIYGYMASDIWLRTMLIVRKETRCHHIRYSFRLAARVLLYAYPTDRTAHTMAFVTPVVEHWLEREIAQWVHPMKDRSNDPSHHERTLLPRSYISLPHFNKLFNTEKRTVLTLSSFSLSRSRRSCRCRPLVEECADAWPCAGGDWPWDDLCWAELAAAAAALRSSSSWSFFANSWLKIFKQLILIHK